MRIPRSILFFVATGVVYLLQVAPIPGIFLMFLLAPFWSVILINLGFVGMTIEALTFKVARAWIILPILWFGGYAGFALSDHVALWRVQDEIAATNANVRVAFDPARHALVTDDAAWLVQNYALPVVYSQATTGGNSGYFATRLLQASACREIGQTRTFTPGVSVMGFHDQESGLGGKFGTHFCIARLRESPRLPIIIVSRNELSHVASGLPIRESRTTIGVPGGATFLLRGGTATPLSWAPIPVMGCGLDSGAPAWRCFAQFRRDHVTLQPDGLILAKALNLMPVSANDRVAGDPTQLLARAVEVRHATVRQATDNLDRALANPGEQIGGVPFNALRGRMDIIIPRLGRIVTAIERGLAMQGNGRNNAQQMFHLVEQAPSDKVAPYLGRVEALKDEDSWFVFNPKPVLIAPE